MKVRHLLVGLSTLFSGFFVAPTHAVTYSHDTTIRFTFNSEINVTISDAEIEILDLAPGTSSDSNIVSLTISTNNVVGYTASASVGNAQKTTTSMVHTNGANAFTSIATNASLASLNTDNTWGYATSNDGGSSWSNLSGLPLYVDAPKQIAVTDSPASDAIKFKINAKAATSQLSGDYTNVINFTVVANVPPKTIGDVLDENPNTPKDPDTNLPIIQAINEDVCEATEAIGEPTVVTDIRDHTNYLVAKLADNRCWLLDNLALDLASENVNITASNTNANAAAINALFNGGGTSSDGYASTGVASWDTNPIASYSEHEIYGKTPLYYTSLKDSTSSDSSELDALKNVKFGILYNYCAASAGSYCYGNETSAGTPTDVAGTAIDSPYDICPAGWRMPTGDTYDATNRPEGGEIEALYDVYNGNGFNIRTALRLPLSGNYEFRNYSEHDQNNLGYFWTSTWYDSPDSWLVGEVMYIPFIFNNNVYPRNYGNRFSFAYSVRCLVNRSPRLTINYNANGGTGTMGSQEVSSSKSATLLANTYTRNGFIFNGWNTRADGAGTAYADKDTYYPPANSASVTLYAQWIEDSGSGGSGGGGASGRSLARAFEEAYIYNHGTFDGHMGMYVPHKNALGEYDGTYYQATVPSDYYGIPARDLRFNIQDISLTIEENGETVCERATAINSEAYVVDLRDYSSYRLVKAADGRCWMSDNLSLDLTNSAVQARMNSTNTNANDTALNYLFHGGGSDSDRYATEPVAIWEQYHRWDAPKILTSEKNSVSGNRMDSEGNWKIGVVYNFCAASAGSYCDGSFKGGGNGSTYGSPVDVAGTAIDSIYDICPAGWRLPTSGVYDETNAPDGGEFGNLYAAYDSNIEKLRRALHISFAGQNLGSSSVGQYTILHSSTKASANSMYQAYIYGDSYASMTGSYGRNNIVAVRCIAKK